MHEKARLPALKPECYLGVEFGDKIIIGPQAGYDSKTDTLTMSRSVVFDAFEYEIVKTSKQPRKIRLGDRRILLGKYLVGDIGGEEKLDLILDAMDRQLGKDEWEHYRVQLKAEKAAEKAKERAYKREVPGAEIAGKFLAPFRSFRYDVMDNIKAKSKEPVPNFKE